MFQALRSWTAVWNPLPYPLWHKWSTLRSRSRHQPIYRHPWRPPRARADIVLEWRHSHFSTAVTYVDYRWQASIAHGRRNTPTAGRNLKIIARTTFQTADIAKAPDLSHPYESTYTLFGNDIVKSIKCVHRNLFRIFCEPDFEWNNLTKTFQIHGKHGAGGVYA